MKIDKYNKNKENVLITGRYQSAIIRLIHN